MSPENRAVLVLTVESIRDGTAALSQSSAPRAGLKRTGLLLLLLAVLTGCAHSVRERSPTSTAAAIQNSHLLYIRSEKCRSLFVEVDAVEGAEFSETELRSFEAFLGEWCDKPDGITVAKGSVIARAAARGHSAHSLARRYLDGPTLATNGAQPAYLYVLVYDNRVNRNPAQSPRGASQWPITNTVSSELARSEDPHVEPHPYPAMIYIDRSWAGGLLPKRYWYDTLIHEAGHVMGLVSRQAGAREPHCATRWCVMEAGTSDDIRRDIMGWLKPEKPRPPFCDACAAELRGSRTSGENTRTSFAGPVLVRRMPSYQVLSLPGFCGLYIVDAVEAEVPEFIAQFRKLPSGERKGIWDTARVRGNQSRESVLQAIEAAKRDVDPNVCTAARKLERSVRSE